MVEGTIWSFLQDEVMDLRHSMDRVSGSLQIGLLLLSVGLPCLHVYAFLYLSPCLCVHWLLRGWQS